MSSNDRPPSQNAGARLPVSAGKPTTAGAKVVPGAAGLPQTPPKGAAPAQPLKPNTTNLVANPSVKVIPPGASSARPAVAPTGAQPVQRAQPNVPLANSRSGIPVNPAARSSVRESLRCTICASQLPADFIAKKAAIVVDGRPVCIQCHTQLFAKKTVAVPVINVKWIFAGLGLFLVGAAIFPAQFLFLSCIFSLLTAGVALLGLEMRARTRVIVVTVALFACAGSAFGIHLMNVRGGTQKVRQDIAEEVSAFESLLAKGMVGEASQLVVRLDQQYTNPKGEYTHSAAREAVDKMRQGLDDWYNVNYGGNLTVDKRTLFAKLFSVLPPRTSRGTINIKWIKIEGEKVSFTYVTDFRAPDPTLTYGPENRKYPCDPETLRSITAIAMCTFDAVPKARVLALEVIGETADAEVPIGHFLIGIEDAQMLRNGGQPEDVLSFLKKQ
jgi:hypothetical protein